MKIRILAIALAGVSVAAGSLHASIPVPAVPDSGGTVGALALGLLLVVALRRKLAK
ncbi:MAG TPA: VPDSG-CTERM sorting domain-containing protein [Lacunisphaera sp.]|nr:VPDSG-CTERM sorting domain-containing protein [Lacunisphaera sp.]